MVTLLKRTHKPKLKKGDKFSNLTAIQYVGHKEHSKRVTSQWLFLCDCGKECIKDDIQVRRGHTKSCTNGCHSYLGKGISLENKLYDTYKRHAISRNIEFEITKEDFIKLTKLNCEYCNIKPIQQYRSKSKISQEPLLYNGIDRVVNKKGYSILNCVPCCKRCNIAKGNMTQEEFRNWIINVLNTKSKYIF